MFDFLLSRGFLPHGYCMQWRPELLWLHVWSDIGIAVAYFSIPAMLIFYLRRLTRIESIPSTYLLISMLFAAFILLCGVTHIFGLLTIWKPFYGAQGIIKAATAFVSIATAIAMVPLLPKALSLRLPESYQAQTESLQRRLDASEAKCAKLKEELAAARAQSKAG